MSEPIRVLVADDESHVRILMKNVISRIPGALVDFATDGQEAVDRYRAQRPDLVLMDVNMPRKSGPDALREILAGDPQARVMMLTSVSDRETVVRCVQEGAVNYVRKDTHLQQIKDAIEQALGVPS